MLIQPFAPKYGSGLTIAVSATAPAAVDASVPQIRVTNTGAAIGYFRCYRQSAVASTAGLDVATAADMPVLAGTSVIVNKGDADRIATFSAGTNFHVICGIGGH